MGVERTELAQGLAEIDTCDWYWIDTGLILDWQWIGTERRRWIDHA